jgi:23S rRNA pseudouridine1911/1915/1917 synthase
MFQGDAVPPLLKCFTMPAIEFLVEYRERNETVAELLHKRFRITWSQAKRVVEKGHVRIAGQTTRAPEQRVKKGNRVWIAPGAIEVKTMPVPGAAAKKGAAAANAPVVKKPEKPQREEPKVDIDIVYSDDAIVIVNKQAGLTTVRNAEEAAEFGARAKKFLPKTLADYLPAALNAPNKPVFAVHRIDRETTGLVAFARTKQASEHLMKQFRKHSTERHYLALTRGTPPERRISSTLVENRGDGRRGSRPKGSEEIGKNAVTHVRVLESFPQFALVECKLETGRTHQVRIHLGEAGFPLCGEVVYDRPPHGKKYPDGSGATRPMLHAARLGIIHPETDEPMLWDAAPPADFTQLLQSVRTKKTMTEDSAV